MKTDAGVSARIFSPDRDVCSAVADKLPVLLQSIEQNGLTMQELEIIHAPADFAGNAAQRPVRQAGRPARADVQGRRLRRGARRRERVLVRLPPERAAGRRDGRLQGLKEEQEWA